MQLNSYSVEVSYMQCCYDDRPATTLLFDHRNILKSNLALLTISGQTQQCIQAFAGRGHEISVMVLVMYTEEIPCYILCVRIVLFKLLKTI